MNKKRNAKKSKKPIMLPNLLFFTLLRTPKNNADEIHRAYTIYYFRNSRSLKDKLLVLLRFIISPVVIARDIITYYNIIGKKKHIKKHKSFIGQLIEQFYLAFFFSIDSENYYLQGFYLEGGMKRARNFVNEKVLKNGVYKLLANYKRYILKKNKTCNLGKKVDFFSFCDKNGLAAVPVLMEFLANGKIKYHSLEEYFPEESIFCKPNVDNEGQGAEAWFWDSEEKKFYNLSNQRMCKKDLIVYLSLKANKHQCGSILVQPLVLPHHKLEAFRKNATPTIRIISSIDSIGNVSTQLGMFRFSTDSRSVVDNASSGGMVAPINITEGILGMAIHSNVRLSNERFKFLCSPHIKVNGFELPFWNDTVKLVKKSHELLPDRIIIGWDILITEKGPMILEANSQPGICFIQRAYGNTEIPTIIGQTISKNAKKAIKTLYSGVIGEGKYNNGRLDLYGGSVIKKKLSWCILKNEKIVEIKIIGKVQNVGYRDWLKKKAKDFKIRGWVQNNPDNTVNAMFKGRAIDIEDLIRDCYIGPPKAKVKSITVKWGTDDKSKEFKVIPN